MRKNKLSDNTNMNNTETSFDIDEGKEDKMAEQIYSKAKDELDETIAKALSKYDKDTEELNDNDYWFSMGMYGPLFSLVPLTFHHYRWHKKHNETKDMIESYLDHTCQFDMQEHDPNLPMWEQVEDRDIENN